MSNPPPRSCSHILKSSSLIGGAQGVNLLIGMARTKFVALLIGPVGVRLAVTYGAIQKLVGSVVGLGIGASAMRKVAEAGFQCSVGIDPDRMVQDGDVRLDYDPECLGRSE